jgi:hypothetical protein
MGLPQLFLLRPHSETITPRLRHQIVLQNLCSSIWTTGKHLTLEYNRVINFLLFQKKNQKRQFRFTEDKFTVYSKSSQYGLSI